MKEVLFIQFANIAAYPPGLNALQMFEESGVKVSILALSPRETNAVDFPDSMKHLDVRHTRFYASLPKVSFLLFFLTASWKLLRYRKRFRVVYGFDIYSAPLVALAHYLGCKTVYHEHDSPEIDSPEVSRTQKQLLRWRLLVLKKSSRLIFPSEERYEKWSNHLQWNREGVHFIFNSPLRSAWNLEPSSQKSEKIFLHYHGNISEKYVPTLWLDVLSVLPSNYQLSLVGYEAQNSPGYMERFLVEAKKKNVQERVIYAGAMSRSDLNQYLKEMNIGIGVMSYGADQNFNERNLFPASNKTWDYLSSQLSVIVDYEQLGVYPEDVSSVIIPCDSTSPDSIVQAVLVAQRGVFPERIASKYCFEARYSCVLDDILNL